MNYQQIPSPSALADFCIEIGMPTPKNTANVNYPYVIPYEVVEAKDAEPGYVMHPPVPLIAFELGKWETEIVALEVWYRSFSDRGMPSDEYQQLLKARNRLSDVYKHLGVQKSRLVNEERDARYMRDLKVARVKGIYKQSGDNADTANYKALKDCKQEYDDLTKWVTAKNEIQAHIASCNHLLNAMSGVRSTLEKELNYAGQTA